MMEHAELAGRRTRNPGRSSRAPRPRSEALGLRSGGEGSESRSPAPGGNLPRRERSGKRALGVGPESSDSLAIFAVGRRGVQVAGRIRRQLGGDVYIPERFRSLAPEDPSGSARSRVFPFEAEGIKVTLAAAFRCYRGLILVLPLGAAVRLLAPLLSDKRTDPAVIVVDEIGTNAIAALSGHTGGANDLARRVAAAIGARPVITTAADVLGSLALDLLGQEWGWSIEDGAGLTRASAAVLDGEPVGVYQDAGEEEWWCHAPANLTRYGSLDDLNAAPVAAQVIVTDRLVPAVSRPTARVVFRPRTLVVGIGCVRGVTAEEIEDLIRATLLRHGLALASVRELTTIDLKQDESGLTALVERHGWPIRYFSAEELAPLGAPSGRSIAVEQAVGTPGVCEPAALLAAAADSLVVPKVKNGRVTVAVARIAGSPATGHVAVVGIGPGAPEHLTERAHRALVDADSVVGYHAYLDQVRPWLGTKEFYGSAIGEEAERCRLAIALARAGRRVALVSSGDAGIYGMAGLVFELLGDARTPHEPTGVDVEVVPGVSAAQAAAALLGAPLMCDFVAISLSDLLTPWPVIVRRLEAAGHGDLVVAIYNPASARRRHQLREARGILLRYRPPDTLVGIVRNATRPGQRVTITDLDGLLDEPVDMLTTVIVGNSATVRIGDRLVTKRGYPAVGKQQ